MDKIIDQTIDDEWTSFLSKNNDDDEDANSYSSDDALNKHSHHLNTDKNNSINYPTSTADHGHQHSSAPESTPIYISTKSKIAYLLDPVDLKIFWDIPVISYGTARNGVIKKQIKFNSKTAEELNIIQKRLEHELYYDEHVMSHIDNPNGRIKFKDIRKITIGISKKDIMSYRAKKKQAFYNCFVMIIRIKFSEIFREFHIKVFNTGKLEIPGVQSDEMFEVVLQNIIQILQPHVDKPLSYKQTSDTVLINSNFNCGFYINREVLFDILKYKYKIQAIYDPCSYPGIQCKFYYNNNVDHNLQTGIQLVSIPKSNNNKTPKLPKTPKPIKSANSQIIEVSFMIFRTGSVLIVGMCEEYILNDIYTYLTNMLKTEFEHICQNLIIGSHIALKDKKKKIRKKIITVMMTETVAIATEREHIPTLNSIVTSQNNINKNSDKDKDKDKDQDQSNLILPEDYIEIFPKTKNKHGPKKSNKPMNKSIKNTGIDTSLDDLVNNLNQLRL
jgi:TATA-box binding protein (TBP) (component of TFIID and TFIIIB)